MLNLSSRKLTPHMSSQQSLVGTLSASLGLADWVCDDSGPYTIPKISPHLFSPGHLRTPQPAKHVSSVLRMVSHHVQCLPAFKPLLHGFHFAQLDNRVKVAGHEDVHLRVEGGEEPPDHGEHVSGVGKEGMRQLVDRTEVEAVIGTGKAAEFVHQWVF